MKSVYGEPIQNEIIRTPGSNRQHAHHLFSRFPVARHQRK
jgi:hypothetical protein